MTSIRAISSMIATGVVTFETEGNITAGLIAGIALFLVWGAPAATKTIFVLDNETGQMTAQPLDKAAQRYLDTKE